MVSIVFSGILDREIRETREQLQKDENPLFIFAYFAYFAVTNSSSHFCLQKKSILGICHRFPPTSFAVRMWM